MGIAAYLMIVPDRNRPATVSIISAVGNLVRRHMDMGAVIIVVCRAKKDCGPIRSMGELMMRLR